jgi:phosphoribosyl-ATP pyrophosphohydrolase
MTDPAARATAQNSGGTTHTIDRLAATVRARRASAGDASYTRQLLDAGLETCARKFGEESIELIVAALGPDQNAVTAEAADVLYHLLVLLESRGVDFAGILAALDKRMPISGLEEKAARPKVK